ncbi:MAG: hypothetical protein GX488_06720 [Clostridiales bacterium]|nr:hypothetical protein [Clostridiales bacterium]
MEIKQEIFEQAKRIYRETLTSDDENILSEMCLSAYEELGARLKEEISVESVHEKFVRAAAVLGISMFLTLDCSDVDSFSAGKVTLKRRGSGSLQGTAASLRNQAELMLAGCLKDDGFFFGTVKP